MKGYLCDASGEPYNAETFNLDEYLSRFDVDWLASKEGRAELVKDDILLFGVLYLPHLLRGPDGDITFSDVHLGLYRDAMDLAEPAGPEGTRHAYVAPRGSGKALALDTPVLTVNRGWVQHGDLAVGDQVFDETGTPCNVVGLSPIWKDRTCYRLTFSDGEQVIADAAHEWPVIDRWRDTVDAATDTETIAQKWRLPTARSVGGKAEARFRINMPDPLQYPERKYSISPYVLGVWLGDGTSAGATITVGNEDADNLMEQLAAEGEAPTIRYHPSCRTTGTVQLWKPRPHLCPREHVLEAPLPSGHGKSRPCRQCIADWQVFHKTKRATPMATSTNLSMNTRLRDLDLTNNKHIPEDYFLGSAAQRLALLQGLMDTDGYISDSGACEFSVTNERLCMGTLRLIRSLGMKARIREGRAKIHGRDVGPRWRISFTPHLQVFRLPRKAVKVRAERTSYTGARRISNVEQVANRDTSCIEVDSPSHLYLVGETLIPTHNSTTLFVLTTLWLACNYPQFLCAFSSSAQQSIDHLKAVRKELTGSPGSLLQLDFPDACRPVLKANGTAVADSDSMLFMQNGFCFAARGIDTEVLGLVDPLNRRPAIIWLDDIEGADGSGYSKYQASQRLKTITDGILPMNDRAHVRLVGTVTIPGGLVHQLIRSATETGEPEQWITDERFTVTYFPPIILREDGTPRSTWPGKWPIEYLLSIQHTRSFKKNMANLPVSEDGEYWSLDDIRYGTLGPLATRWILQVDPALEQKSTNDWTGLTVVAARPASKDWQAWRAKVGPHVDPHTAPLPWPEGLPEWMDPSQSQCEIVHASQVRLAGEPLKAEILRLLARHQRIKYVRLETNAGGSLWDVVLKGLPVKMLTHKSSASKEVRFAEALSFWQENRVIHREKIAVLEDQLTAFPKAQFDDVADSCTLAVLYFLGVSRRVQVGATTVAYT